MSDENIYAPPTVSEVSAPDSGELQLATLGSRFVGAFIDGIINAAFSFSIVGILIVASVFDSFAAFGQAGFGTTILFSLLGYGFFIAINFKFLSSSGQTIGKRAAKTKIVTLDGKVPSISDLAGKRYAFMYLIGAIPFVGGIISLVDILFIFGKDRRCIHDLLANTKVVNASTLPSPQA